MLTGIRSTRGTSQYISPQIGDEPHTFTIYKECILLCSLKHFESVWNAFYRIQNYHEDSLCCYTVPDYILQYPKTLLRKSLYSFKSTYMHSIISQGSRHKGLPIAP